MMDYVNFCKNYFTVTNIPVNLMEKDRAIYSSLGEQLSLDIDKTYQVFWTVSPSEQNPCFCRYSPDIEYGWVHIEGTDHYVVLGPVFSIPVTEELIREFMRENALSLEYKESVAEFLCAIPVISSTQFASHLSLLHMSLNGKEADFPTLVGHRDTDVQARAALHTQKIADNLENENLHNSYDFERQLWEHIKNGNTETLETFLVSNTIPLTEGRLANTPLRQAKNLFIITVAKISVLAAIPGGMDVEKAYQLMDLYIQECERLQTISDIKDLQYSMILDFCHRAGETRIPDGISSEVYQCINYIRSHVNEPVTIEDVAAQIGKSPSHATRHFKNELGINMGAFITRCKLEEAKSLLTYSNMSLSEISSYLCFTNQSYFQNVFKKKYGITPLQYRKQNRRM